MTRLISSLVAVVVAALLLSACGSDGGSAGGDTTVTTAPDPTTATQPASGLPVVTGTFGEKPAVTLPSPTPGGYQVTVLSTGTGPVVKAGDQLTVHYLGETWRGGSVFDQSYDRGAPVTFPIGVGGLIPGWDEGLVGKTVGSRVLLVLPPEKGYGTSGNPQAGIEPTDTLVFVVDILGTETA
jgi:peptidylprolyl isomerase